MKVYETVTLRDYGFENVLPEKEIPFEEMQADYIAFKVSVARLNAREYTYPNYASEENEKGNPIFCEMGDKFEGLYQRIDYRYEED